MRSGASGTGLDRRSPVALEAHGHHLANRGCRRATRPSTVRSRPRSLVTAGPVAPTDGVNVSFSENRGLHGSKARAIDVSSTASPPRRLSAQPTLTGYCTQAIFSLSAFVHRLWPRLHGERNSFVPLNGHAIMIGRCSDAANGLHGRTRYRSQLPDGPYMRPSMCVSFTVCA